MKMKIATGQSWGALTKRRELQRAAERTNRRERIKNRHRKPSVVSESSARRQRENRRDKGEESIKWAE